MMCPCMLLCVAVSLLFPGLRDHGASDAQFLSKENRAAVVSYHSMAGSDPGAMFVAGSSCCGV